MYNNPGERVLQNGANQNRGAQMDNMIQEIRSGNKDAVKTVYQEYAKDVYNFAKSITGDHDSALAATKKTFLTLFKNIQNGDEPANLRTAALKIAYDEAYKMAAPKQEAVEEAVVEEPAPRQRTAPAEAAPVYEDEYEEEYETSTYEEEEDDFVPPQRQKDADREEVYVPKGGYDTLKIDPVNVDNEEARPRRRRRPEPEEEFEEQPRQQRRARQAEEFEEEPRQRRPRPEESRVNRRAQEVDVYALDEDGNVRDDYEDEYIEEEEKPRNKGLFIFCIILNIILIIILLWFLGGLLVNLGVLPDIDLGYSWFNGHIYPLF